MHKCLSDWPLVGLNRAASSGTLLPTWLRTSVRGEPWRGKATMLNEDDLTSDECRNPDCRWLYSFAIQEAQELLLYWQRLEQALPPRHTLLISGPTLNGMYTVGVVRNVAPTTQIAKGRGTLVDALKMALDDLNSGV